MDIVDGVQEIFSACIDVATENIFYVTQTNMHSLSEVISNKDSSSDIDSLKEVIDNSVTETLKNVEERGLNYPSLTTDNILIHESQVFLQNPLLSKANTGIICYTYIWSMMVKCFIRKIIIKYPKIFNPKTFEFH